MRKFKVRDVSEESDGPTWDIIFTGSDGIQRYSDEVWHSEPEAMKAKETYEKDEKFIPDYWDSLTI